MEKSALEQSIRDEAARTIAAVREEQSREIDELDRAYAGERDAWRKQVESESADRLSWERSRIENRGILESRKLRLRSLDELVRACAESALGRVRKDPRYRDYLVHVIGQALEQVEGPEAVIYLGEEDFAYEKDIRESCAGSGNARECRFLKDAGITRGGGIVEDREKGRIINGTLERAYFRKTPDIRREAMEVLKKHGCID